MRALLQLLKILPNKTDDFYIKFANGSHEYTGNFFNDLVKAFKHGKKNTTI